MKSERRTGRIKRVVQSTQVDLTVILENIHDPHNVSAVLRSCDAVGVRKVGLVYTSESFPKIGRQSSASAGKWVERTKFRSVEECYDSLRKDGFLIAASVLAEESVPLYDLDLTRKIALVFGNEHRGVSADASDHADVKFRIPMNGMIQSLNVSVACAVSLYEALRQRMAKGSLSSHGPGETEIAKMIDAWLRK
ncbi:MAG: RNA methyltransferase [Bacteroidetes bacterium]|nr:RNA methyltransferase [Bacteroidota bacterium]